MPCSGLTWHLVEQCPEGYPRLAALVDSDENFMLYRRFGFLQARLLLSRQDELRRLEERLDSLDKKHSKENSRWLHSREDDDIMSGDRKKLMLEIEEKFQSYGYCQSPIQESPRY
jgi:hypothetical protein